MPIHYPGRSVRAAAIAHLKWQYSLTTQISLSKWHQPTHTHMQQDVATYMKYYNLDQLHTSNGDMSPINYENPRINVSSFG